MNSIYPDRILRAHRSADVIPTALLPARINKPYVAELVLKAAKLSASAQHVYVHCYFENAWDDAFIRIWRSTFLVDHNSGEKASLVHAENIAVAPLWMLIPNKRVHRFLLIFSRLPKDCSSFDLVEDIPQSGGFCVRQIDRNRQDVYHVDI
jgi:hypothetical protein